MLDDQADPHPDDRAKPLVIPDGSLGKPHSTEELDQRRALFRRHHGRAKDRPVPLPDDPANERIDPETYISVMVGTGTSEERDQVRAYRLDQARRPENFKHQPPEKKSISPSSSDLKQDSDQVRY